MAPLLLGGGFILVTFLFACFGYPVLADKVPHSFLDLWDHWDTGHYLKIVRFGYSATQFPETIAFFPLYPFLVRILNLLIGNDLLCALLIANVSYLGTCLLLYRLFRLDRNEQDSLRAVFYLSIFPSAYFLHAAYAESLFMMFAIASMHSARLSRWRQASLLCALCTATRITGLALLPALLVEYFEQRKTRTRLIERDFLYLGLAPTGFLLYLVINWKVFGDPFRFLEFQRTVWFKSPAPFWTGMAGAWGHIFDQPARNAALLGVSEWGFALLALILSISTFFRTRLSYATFAMASWFLVTGTSFWVSMPRYALCIFPIFLPLSDLGRKTVLHDLITFAFILLFALYFSQFIQGSWAF